MLTTNQILQQGRYRIVSQLGQNGIGMGYEARDTVSGANVLLKEIRENGGKVATVAQIEARKAAFAEKAKRLTEIKHESVLAVKDFFSEIDHHYLVTDFIDGNNLIELLEKKKNPFPLIDVANWADTLLDALNYLHTRQPLIIHGEVKPQNIKLQPNGKVKLLIFHLFKPADEKMNSAVSNQTFDAAVLPYLPLEQIWQGLDAASKKVILTDYDEKSERILEQSADARSDVYSLAATVYHLLTARAPADALTRSIDILEGKADPLLPPNKINPLVPPQISDVLMKALEIKRENRFSSAVIMRQVLRTAFVRLKELEAAGKQDKTEEESVLEIPLNQQKPLAPKPAPKNPEVVSEQAKQLELIKRQLREAEARRLEAERRAAEAEARLLEAEKHISIEPSPEKPKVVEAAVEEPKIVEAANEKPKVVEQIAPPVQVEERPAAAIAAVANDDAADEFSTLFAGQPKESGVFKKVAAAAVVLLILGGAGFVVWTFVQPKSINPAQTATANATVAPEPTVEATPAPVTENPPASDYQAATTEPTPQTESAPSSDPQSAATVKPKSAAATPTPQTAQVKKPAATPAKTAEKPKKVTLDDLLKDN